MIEEQQFKDALGRIALTQDGKLLHIWLQRWLMCLAPSSEAGALQTFEGERRFAARLKQPMDESIAENASGGTGDTPSERPIVIARAGVVQRSASPGARRRVGPDPGTGR